MSCYTYCKFGTPQTKEHGKFMILGSTMQDTCYLGDTQPVACSDYFAEFFSRRFWSRLLRKMMRCFARRKLILRQLRLRQHFVCRVLNVFRKCINIHDPRHGQSVWAIPVPKYLHRRVLHTMTMNDKYVCLHMQYQYVITIIHWCKIFTHRHMHTYA